jgi:hypothetical protein
VVTELLRDDDPVILPHLGSVGRLWAAVVDVAEQRPHGWTLIGALMVMLHEHEAGAPIAVLFEPARHRVRSLVDRVLYGRDADAYEVLSELASRLRDAGSAEQVASQVASLLVRGSGASAVRIHLQLRDRAEEIALVGAADELVALTAPVLHDGEQVGEVTLHARSIAELAPDAGDLVADVTGMLGAVLRNALLTAELREQVAALRRSRQRLVEAQDSARRDLERDLHDGAQARLIALRLQVGLLDAELAGHGGVADAVQLRQRCGHRSSRATVSSLRSERRHVACRRR